jgi:hypothetical protein
MVQAPIAVEIISTEQQARPLADAAQRAYDTTRAVLTQARTGAVGNEAMSHAPDAGRGDSARARRRPYPGVLSSGSWGCR